MFFFDKYDKIFQKKCFLVYFYCFFYIIGLLLHTKTSFFALFNQKI